MLKRTMALLLAVIIPITLLLTACGKQLTVNEYYKELQADFEEWDTAVNTKLYPLIVGTASAEAAKSRQKDADAACDNAERALDKIAEINPPSEFSEKHKKLVKTIDIERDWLKAARKFFAAKDFDEIMSAANELSEISDKPFEQHFFGIYSELIAEVKAAAEQ